MKKLSTNTSDNEFDDTGCHIMVIVKDSDVVFGRESRSYTMELPNIIHEPADIQHDKIVTLPVSDPVSDIVDIDTCNSNNREKLDIHESNHRVVSPNMRHNHQNIDIKSSKKDVKDVPSIHHQDKSTPAQSNQLREELEKPWHDVEEPLSLFQKVLKYGTKQLKKLTNLDKNIKNKIDNTLSQTKCHSNQQQFNSDISQENLTITKRNKPHNPLVDGPVEWNITSIISENNHTPPKLPTILFICGDLIGQRILVKIIDIISYPHYKKNIKSNTITNTTLNRSSSSNSSSNRNNSIKSTFYVNFKNFIKHITQERQIKKNYPFILGGNNVNLKYVSHNNDLLLSKCDIYQCEPILGNILAGNIQPTNCTDSSSIITNTTNIKSNNHIIPKRRKKCLSDARIGRKTMKCGLSYDHQRNSMLVINDPFQYFDFFSQKYQLHPIGIGGIGGVGGIGDNVVTSRDEQFNLIPSFHQKKHSFSTESSTLSEIIKYFPVYIYQNNIDINNQCESNEIKDRTLFDEQSESFDRIIMERLINNESNIDATLKQLKQMGNFENIPNEYHELKLSINKSIRNTCYTRLKRVDQN